jgi:DNA polymerase III subunit epsilon
MAFSLLQPLSEIPICVVDVETTGIAADSGDRVIELGIVRLESGRIVAEYQQLFDPGRHISPGIVAITGITPQMLAGQPRFSEHLDRIMDLLAGAILLGHNVGFDLSFLRMEFRRVGREIAHGSSPILDTLRIARRRFGRGGNALGRLASRLGIGAVGAHRALADARTTHLIFERLMEPVGGWKIPLCDCLLEHGPSADVVPASSQPNPLPVELAEALELRRPVLMDYLDGSDNRTQRVIEPLEIRRFRGELVLVAHCRLRNDRRNFKVERIVELQRIEQLSTNFAS